MKDEMRRSRCIGLDSRRRVNSTVRRRFIKSLPGPPNYQFKPLTHQFDDGFGLMGDAFNDAALRLEHSTQQEEFINSSLPIGYLYRHAIELYLKSIIIVLHRNLGIPFGPNPAIGAPLVHVGKEW